MFLLLALFLLLLFDTCYKCFNHLMICFTGDIFAQRSPAIHTIPTLPDSTIATGYVGLQLTIRVQSGRYRVCSWRYGNIFFADLFAPTCNSDDGEGYALTCENSSTLITSNLTILSAASESLTIRVDCQEHPFVPKVERIAAINLTVLSKN